MTDLSGAGVRVLLIGTATHNTTLPSVPSVTRTVNDLREVLTEQCGVPAEQLETLHDPADAQTMASAVVTAAGQAETVLLVYFAGHGLLDQDNKLYLAAGNTARLTDGMEEHQALSFASLRKAARASRAGSIVVILDCAFRACVVGRRGLRFGLRTDTRARALPHRLGRATRPGSAGCRAHGVLRRAHRRPAPR